MFNSLIQRQSGDLGQDRRMRFSSYHELSSLLKRKHRGRQNSMFTDKKTGLEETTGCKGEAYSEYQMGGNSRGMRVKSYVNPEVQKLPEKQFYRSKPESRITSAIQPSTKPSLTRPTTSTYRNTTLKISTLSTTLDLLRHQLLTARRQLNLTLSDKTKLSESLQNELMRIKDVQSKEIGGLAKKFRVKREMDVKRKGDVWDEVNNLWYGNENLKQSLFQIQLRVEKLQIQMGNHSNL